MVCPNCNRLRTNKQCYVHNVITCIACLYDGLGVEGQKSFCNDTTMVIQSKKWNAEKDAEYDKLLNMIPKDNTWIPQ